ncbi:AbrB/MazE/SpoVT family DNA-binding domain-containing protein [Candidatus Woesearchaeota archaeon]|nr:AbrB/MazE/SpoVT family DNA-binding domain-containing protein [Candidatus Woesearchaeota archaeon]
MIETVNVSSRGQIVIPEKIRKKYEISRGDKLVLIDTGNEILVKKEEDIANALLKSYRINEEIYGGMILAEKSLAKDWNLKEDEIWDKC